MKFLVVLLVVVAVLWLIGAPSRRLRGRGDDAGAAAPRTPPPLQDRMVACPQCGLHLPRGEALPGRGGLLFCSEAHRVAYERAHPSA